MSRQLLLFRRDVGTTRHFLPEKPRLVTVEDLLGDVAFLDGQFVESLDEVFSRFRIRTGSLPMPNDRMNASPFLEFFEPPP